MLQFIPAYLFSDEPNLAKKHVRTRHYENTPMQYTAIFHGCKNDNFQMKFLIFFFHIFAQNIYCGYTLEPTIYVLEQK